MKVNATMRVKIKAEKCEHVAPGHYELELSVVPLKSDEANVLERLFPHTASEIEAALAKEALLSAMQ